MLEIKEEEKIKKTFYNMTKDYVVNVGAAIKIHEWMLIPRWKHLIIEQIHITARSYSHAQKKIIGTLYATSLELTW